MCFDSKYPGKLPLPEDFSLRDTLNCGQCFRWNEQPDGSFSGWAGNRHASLIQIKNTLFLSDSDTAFWEDYLDLKADYREWKEQFKQDPALSLAIDYCGGIRILRQDLWETTISFIISANNNIPRIKGIINRLCTLFGEDGSFPTPDKLASLTVEDLIPIRAGFRAKYILDAAAKITSGEVNLTALDALPLEKAEHELRKINGIGPKVAQCVLLYSLHRLDAFPIDTWMKKVLERYYPNGLPDWINPRGVAQQYLFHYVRSLPSDD